MEIAGRIISPFHVEAERANLDTFHKEFIKMTFDLEVKSMYTFKRNWVLLDKQKTVAKHP